MVTTLGEGDLSPLHQICPEHGQTLRIALLNEFCEAKASFYHWYRNAFYRCNTVKDGVEHECCAHSQRSWTCVSLALAYQSADTHGKVALGADIEFRVGYIGLARSVYQQVSECEIEAPGCDLYYTNKDGRYSIAGASRQPRWKDSPQAGLIRAAAAEWADSKKLIEKLGKKLTDEEWHWLITTGSPLQPEED